MNYLQSSGKSGKQSVGFEVLMAVSMKIAVFWVVAPCSLVEVYQRFRGPCFLHHQAMRLIALQPRRQQSSGKQSVSETGQQVSESPTGSQSSPSASVVTNVSRPVAVTLQHARVRGTDRDASLFACTVGLLSFISRKNSAPDFATPILPFLSSACCCFVSHRENVQVCKSLLLIVHSCPM
jgi:hypothetical protein